MPTPDASLDLVCTAIPVMVAASSTMAMMRDIMEGIVGEIDLVAEAKHAPVERVRVESIGNTMSKIRSSDDQAHPCTCVTGISSADPIGNDSRKYYEFAGPRI